jgi:hypothetical protein
MIVAPFKFQKNAIFSPEKITLVAGEDHMAVLRGH